MSDELQPSEIMLAVGLHAIALKRASEILANRLGMGDARSWLSTLLLESLDDLQTYTPEQLEDTLQEMLAAAPRTVQGKNLNINEERI